MEYRNLQDHFREFGFAVTSYPCEGNVSGWLNGLKWSLLAFEIALAESNHLFKTRGRSKMALYWLLTSPGFQKPFGIRLRPSKKKELAKIEEQMRSKSQIVDELLGIKEQPQ